MDLCFLFQTRGLEKEVFLKIIVFPSPNKENKEEKLKLKGFSFQIRRIEKKKRNEE